MDRAAVMFERPVSAKGKSLEGNQACSTIPESNPNVSSVEFTNIRLCGNIFKNDYFMDN